MKNERLIKMLDNAEIKLIKAHKSLDRLNKEFQKKQIENGFIEILESDIKRKKREISDIEKSIEGYREKLKAVQSIEEIPVLREFINNWKILATEYYVKQYNKLIEYKNWLEQQEEIFRQWIEETTGHKYFGSYSATKENEEKRKELKIDYITKTEYMRIKFDAVILTFGMYRFDFDKYIEKIVNYEADRKYINFLNRIKKAVGKTFDCSGLYIADNLEINGIVSGELGKAKVETITAGGHNIQCFHYRVLVNIINEAE